MSLSEEILEGTYEGVQKRLLSGANTNIIDEYGYTPLIHAVATKRPELVKLLLHHGAKPDIMDLSGMTALHWAVDVGSFEITQLLLHAGAQPNAYTPAGQPVLFYPYLRKDKKTIQLLLDKGASLDYVKDFIGSKLIGHRFQLMGRTDIVTPEGLFLSMDLEGFYLEYTLDVIQDSLQRFITSFVAHRMNLHQTELKKIIEAFHNATALRAYKHFTKKSEDKLSAIQPLIDRDLLLLPVSYQGHAITFVKHGEFLAKCDRGVHKMTDPIVINTIGHPEQVTTQFYLDLMYKPQTEQFMKKTIYRQLGLHPYMKLPIKHQITGNCSWANVEASVPTMLYMLLHDRLKDKSKADVLVKEIMRFYLAWLDWDKDRAIDDWLSDFESISFQRQKSKAALLGAVLFQACDVNKEKDFERAKIILKILSRQEFHYIVRIYTNIYVRGNKTIEGQNFKKMIEKCGYQLGQFSY